MRVQADFGLRRASEGDDPAIRYAEVKRIVVAVVVVVVVSAQSGAAVTVLRGVPLQQLNAALFLFFFLSLSDFLCVCPRGRGYRLLAIAVRGCLHCLVACRLGLSRFAAGD